MLHGVLGRDEAGRKQAIGAIGPVWDGNEVWLIVAVAAMFAAFPSWYATMFSGFYLLMLVTLVGLILRGVSFEFRGKRDSLRWRRFWSGALTGQSGRAAADRHRLRQPAAPACRSTTSRSTPVASGTCSTVMPCSPDSPSCPSVSPTGLRLSR